MPTSPETSTAALVSDFATAFNARYATKHTTTSPLGLWLLYALVAPSAGPAPRSELEAVLGCAAGEARRRAIELLRDPHEAVKASLALWAKLAFTTESFTQFSAYLADAATQGDIPTQAEADAWTAEVTKGLIKRFPLSLGDPEITIVLASALATKVTWREAYEPQDPALLGGVFGNVAASVLASQPNDEVAIYITEAAGLVAVHRAEAAEGLGVYSVIAAPDADPGDVHGAAHEVALDGLELQDAMTHPKQVSLFDLPLVGHAWDIVEFEGVGSVRESCDAYLATWRAEALGDDSHDLTGAPGMGATRAVLESFIQDPPGPGKFCAAQSALAEFSLTGFEAAAVTAMMLGRGFSRPPEPTLHRRATIRFNRPYAVLAVGSGSRSGPGSTWRGVPVFSSWVGHPTS